MYPSGNGNAINPRWLAFWRKVKQAAAELDAKQAAEDGKTE